MIGKSEYPVTREYLFGNSFQVTLRDLKESEIPKIESTLEKIKKDGLPNYFDEQRFGSIRHRKGFLAQKVLLKHFNGALKLYVATPSPHDDTPTRNAKKFLAEHWGDWEQCQTIKYREFQPIINYLIKHPKDFKGAIRQTNRKILELLIVTYQSYLWNEILAELLRSLNLKLYPYPYLAGNLLFYQTLPSEVKNYLVSLLIPTPSPKVIFKDEKIEQITTEILGREGFVLKDLKMPLRVRGVFFKPFERKAIIFPEKLSIKEPMSDERYKGKLKLELNFNLSKGSYATILVKRLQVAIGSIIEEPEETADD